MPDPLNFHTSRNRHWQVLKMSCDDQREMSMRHRNNNIVHQAAGLLGVKYPDPSQAAICCG
jgi:hypothetical protein